MLQRSHAEEPEEKEDGDKQEERILPVVVGVPVVMVTVSLGLTHVLVCSVEGVVGVEDCREKAEGKRADAK